MVINKYLTFYKIIFKYSLINAMVYRVSFLMELAVETGYQLFGIMFFTVVYANIQTLGGWNYYEVMLLLGIDIIISELIVGLAFALGMNSLPDKIKNGDVDVALLKPINSQFNLTLSFPYFSSFIAIIPGIFIIYFALSNLSVEYTLLNTATSILLAINGFIIIYSFMVIIGSLSFKFVGTSTLPRLGQNIIFSFSNKPHSIFKGGFRIVFYLLIPAALVSSTSAGMLIGKTSIELVVLSFIMGISLLVVSTYVWNRMLRFYSSASS